MQENQRRLLTGLLVAAVVVGASAVGSRLISQQSSAHSALVRAGLRLGDAAAITFQLPGRAGRIDSSRFTAQSLGVAQLTPAQLASELPGWDVQVVPRGVALTPRQGGKPLYLGILQGQVAIFFGPPRLGWVDQLTGLRSDGLRARDLERLQQGIAVGGVDQAWQLLEGLGG